jgi:hypothetical protein
MRDDFVFVDDLVPGVRWDAKYATWDNFTGRPVDGYRVNRIVGTRALCEASACSSGTAIARNELSTASYGGPSSPRTAGRNNGTIPALTGPTWSRTDMWPPSQATAAAARST